MASPIKRVAKNGQISVGTDAANRLVQIERMADGIFLRFIDLSAAKPPSKKRSSPLSFEDFVLDLTLTACPDEIVGAHGLMMDVVKRKYDDYLASIADCESS